MQDVYELAARWGVAIEYGRWPLATVGEYQARAAKIAVNEAALEVAPDRELAARAIIAHELGHVAARRDGVAREDEEAWAHNFAAQLLGGSNLLAELEAVWRRANDRTFPRY
jgi:hypothetical protein